MLALMTIKTDAFRMTDEEFIKFCLDNPELRIERNEKREILIMSPNFPFSSAINGDIYTVVSNWNKEHKVGRVFDSSAGFFLPDGSLRSPDIAWIPRVEWLRLKEEAKKSYLKYCPHFIVEVKSESDRLKDLKDKMKSWIKNGVRLAWLIDPAEENVWIYRQDGSIDTLSTFDHSLTGENILVGLTLNLSDLRLD